MLHAVNHDVVHGVELSRCHGIVASLMPGIEPGYAPAIRFNGLTVVLGKLYKLRKNLVLQLAFASNLETPCGDLKCLLTA